MKLKKFTQKDRHGNTVSYDFFEDNSVPEMNSIPQHPGEPRGTDTVPAWLTPGEFVMNAEATRKYKPQIEAMNNEGRAIQAAQGGTIPQYKARGGEAGPCWDGYEMVGMKDKGGKKVPNCVPVEYKEGGGFIDYLSSMFGMGQDVPQAAPQAAPEPQLPPGIIPRDYNIRPLDLPPESPMAIRQEPVPVPAVTTPAEPNSYLSQMTNAESSGRADAKNPNSSATGLHQFTSPTWLAVAEKYEPELYNSMSEEELLELRKNPEISTRMVTHLTNENKRILDRKEIPTTNDNLYLLHFGGPSSGVKAITAPADTKAEDIFTEGQLKSNPFLRGMTAEEIRSWSKGKVGDDQASLEVPDKTSGVPQIFSSAVASDKPEGEYFVQEDAGFPVDDNRASSVPSVNLEAQRMGIQDPRELLRESIQEVVTPPAEPMGFSFDNYSDGVKYRYNKYADQVKELGEEPMSPEAWVEYSNIRPTDQNTLDNEARTPTPVMTDEDRAAYVQKQKEQLQKDIADGTVTSKEEIAKRKNQIAKVDSTAPQEEAYDDEVLRIKRKNDALKDIQDKTDAFVNSEEAKALAQIGPSRAEQLGQGESEKDPDKFDKVMSFFEEFGLTDLFDKKEIGRMAAMYLGSRVLGYSHGGSLNFAAKGYAARVGQKIDSHAAQVKKLINDGKYTTASIREYQRSKNPDDLTPVGAKFERTGNTKFVLFNGKKLRVEEVKQGKDTKFVSSEGKVIDVLDPRVSVYDKNMDPGTTEYNTYTAQAAADAVEVFKAVSEEEGNTTDDGEMIVKIDPVSAANTFAGWARDMRMDPKDPRVKAMIGDAYRLAIQEGINRDKLKAKDLEPYLIRASIIRDEQSEDLYKTFDGDKETGMIHPKNLAVLRAKVEQETAEIDKRMSRQVGTKAIYDHARTKWIELGLDGQQKYMDAADGSGWSGFSKFLDEQLDNNKYDRLGLNNS